MPRHKQYFDSEVSSPLTFHEIMEVCRQHALDMFWRGRKDDRLKEGMHIDDGTMLLKQFVQAIAYV
jgi:hypothetical protein